MSSDTVSGGVGNGRKGSLPAASEAQGSKNGGTSGKRRHAGLVLRFKLQKSYKGFDLENYSVSGISVWRS